MLGQLRQRLRCISFLPCPVDRLVEPPADVSLLLDLEILKALRRSPLALDIYSWLTYRTSYQKGRSKPITWKSLQEQFGSDYQDNAQGRRNFKKGFVKQLSKVCKFYEGANVEIVDNGLILNKGKPSVARVETK